MLELAIGCTQSQSFEMKTDDNVNDKHCNAIPLPYTSHKMK